MTLDEFLLRRPRVPGGVEHKYNMRIVKDAVAEVHRDTHEAELQTMQRAFAEVKSTDEVSQC